MRAMWCLLLVLAGVTPGAARAVEPPGVSLPPSVAAPAGVFSLSATGEYTTGDYGATSSTDIWYFPVTLRYETARAALRLTVPYLFVEGPANVLVSAGDHSSMGRLNTSAARRSDSGLGDVIASGTYVLVPEGERVPAIALTGKIKFATADEARGLGTGENDYAAEVGALKNLDRLAAFGGAGYKVLGDPPGINDKNVFYGFAGAEYRFDELRSGGIVLDIAQATTTAGSDFRQLTAYLARVIDRNLTARGYAMLGLSDGAPDWGVGFGLIYYWR